MIMDDGCHRPVIRWTTMLYPVTKPVKRPSYMDLGIEGKPEIYITTLSVDELHKGNV